MVLPPLPADGQSSRAVAGVDGMRGGWVVIRRQHQQTTLMPAASFADVVAITADCAAVAVDMPIGLLDRAERGGRVCDRLARRRLGGRRGASVFSPPCRAALRATTHADAQTINRHSSPDGKGLSRQCWHLFPKLREVDEALSPALQARVVEVHPEVAFTALRDQLAADEPAFAALARKRSAIGRDQRRGLLERAGFSGLDELLAQGRAAGAAADDVLDACVGAWSAGRIACGDAERLPEPPPSDARGLRMEIWF